MACVELRLRHLGSVCKAGFRVTLTNFVEPSTSNGGSAIYTYQVCSPVAGVCTGTARPGESCLDNSYCQKQGQNENPTATCTRDCAVDEFHGISHFDVRFLNSVRMRR